jgi:hypothetical protein
VYASKSFEHLHTTKYARCGLYGEVNLWGTVVEHEQGWRTQFAYPKSLYLPSDTLPHSSAPIQDRLRGLIAYGVNIFVGDDTRNIPLWTKDSGLNSAGLDHLIEIGKEHCDRPQSHQILKKGDRVAVLGRGIAVVEHVDSTWIQAVVWNKCELRIARKEIVWDKGNMRWETDANSAIECLAVERLPPHRGQ